MCMQNKDFVDKCIHSFKKELQEVFDWINTSRRVPFEIANEPRLTGFWGHNINTTLSHQSVLLDMPAIQFEMPPILREQLAGNEEFLIRFSQAIVNAYRTIYDFNDEDKWTALCSKIREMSRPVPGLLHGYDEFREFVATVDSRMTRI